MRRWQTHPRSGHGQHPEPAQRQDRAGTMIRKNPPDPPPIELESRLNRPDNSSRAMMPVIRKPEMTKKISTPMKPPGIASGKGVQQHDQQHGHARRPRYRAGIDLKAEPASGVHEGCFESPRPPRRLIFWRKDSLFGWRKPVRESRFFTALESAFTRLEKPLKNPIYSISYPRILCARRMASFMAQLSRSVRFKRR